MNTTPAIQNRWELDILSALVFSPEACRWFEDMYIGWEVFTDPRAAIVATWAIKRHCEGCPPLVREALQRESADAVSLAESLCLQARLVEAHADLPEHEAAEHMSRLREAVRELAPRWLPRTMHEIGDYFAACARDGKDHEGAIEHLGRVVDFMQESSK